MDDVRILVVAALGRVIEPLLTSAFPGGRVVIAPGPDELRRAVRGTGRFDVAMIDLCCHDRRLEWRFDGLDALQILRDENRATAAIMAAQGDSFEDDHLAEALDPACFPEVVGLNDKSKGPDHLVELIRAAAVGHPLPSDPLPVPTVRPALHEFFGRGRGATAGHLAAGVASGRATSYRTLASLTHYATDTANKLVGYLAPLLTARHETPPGEPLTQAAAYRWCGEHARYLLSWSRRHNPPDNPITRWEPATA